MSSQPARGGLLGAGNIALMQSVQGPVVSLAHRPGYCFHTIPASMYGEGV